MRDWDSSFSRWGQPPAETEETRIKNAIRRIRQAVRKSSKLENLTIHVFVQGSYRNRVNVRQDSDVDVGVLLRNTAFNDRYPSGMTRYDFGNSDATYTYQHFKNDLEEALVEFFGRYNVKRGNKAFNIRETTYQVEADVVPFTEFRNYQRDGTYYGGVTLYPDNGGEIVNFPEHLLQTWLYRSLHYENGVAKNTATSRRFKSVVRILKKLRNEMKKNGEQSARDVPGYLLECMAWNISNTHFTGSSWHTIIRTVLLCIRIHTKSDSECASWREVDNIKVLFNSSQPWTRADAYEFVVQAQRYIEPEE